MAIPELTPEQRRENLRKAAEQRVKRAAFRGEVAAGKVTVAQAIDRADDPIVGRLPVRLLLESVPKIGPAKAKKIMEDIGISKTRRIQGLGKRQREALLAYLG